MGSCGCGDDVEEYQFPGPDGSVYTIGRWVGCEQCHGTAIVLDRVEPDDQRWISLVPPAPVAWHGGHVLPLIDVDKLRRLLVERVTFGPDDDEYSTLDDALRDHLRDCVEAAMFGYGEKAPSSDSEPGEGQEATEGDPGDETASGGRCGPREALQGQAQELAELRAVLDGRLTVWASWRDGEELPDDHGLSDPDGDPIDVDLDASGLIEEVRRRQAKAVIRRVELSDPLGPELGAVLALVDATHALRVDEGDHRPFEAAWESWDEIVSATGATREAAILAATAKLLDLDEDSLRRRCSGSPAAVLRAAMAVVDEQTIDGVVRNSTWDKFIAAVEQLRGATRPPCSTCANWIVTDEETPDGTRLCRLRPDLPARTGDSSCPRYEPLDEADTDPAPQLPGVEIDGNVVRSEGGDDVDSD